jgi:hypothetical protein
MKFNINGRELEVSDEDLTKALEEKTDFELSMDNVVIRTTEEDTKFKDNITRQSQAAGIEIGRKNVLQGIGIDTTGGLHKSDDKSIEALNGFISGQVDTKVEELKIEPDKKIQELSKDLTTAKTTIQSLTGERDNALNSLGSYKKQITIEKNLTTLLPENLSIPKGDMLTLMQTKIKFDLGENDSMFALGEDGQPMKDPTTLENLAPKSVVQSFFDNNPVYLKGAEGGAGGGDSGAGGGKQSLEDFTEEMTKGGIQPNSAKFNQVMTERMKAGTLSV